MKRFNIGDRVIHNYLGNTTVIKIVKISIGSEAQKAAAELKKRIVK